MKKRLLTLFFMLCLLIGGVPATIALAGTGEGFSADNPMVVPEDGLIVQGSCLKGISQDWLNNNKPSDGSTFYIKINVSDSITEIGDGYGGFCLGNGYHLQMDFSNATSLTKINNQVALNSIALSGVLDLSKTNVQTIGKSAFSGCTGLTGVILPDSLNVLGADDGTAGSVFNGCTNLKFVRTASSAETATFELPQGLKVIGKLTFRNTFPKGSNLKIKLPDTVETIGSEAFYSNSAFSQIYLTRESGYSGYDRGAFKANSATECLLIFPNKTSYDEFGPPTRATKTCPVSLQFTENGEVIETQEKLYGQSIQYSKGENGFWNIDENYTLTVVKSDKDLVPDYDAELRLKGDSKILTKSSKVTGDVINGCITVLVENEAVVSKPTVTYTVNGQAVSATSIPTLNVEIGKGLTGSVGVQVTHPLATEEAKESGTYVYFKYCWWDEKDGDVNGPRSESEPDLFSTSTSSMAFNRKYTEQNSIPIRDSNDARTKHGTQQDYYLVEIFGYYVENNETPQLYYKSAHNFIAGDNATDKSYLMNVEVKDAVPVTITPADMTIYMGGDGGYDAVVGEDGEIESSTNSLPHPLFIVDMPKDSTDDPTKLTFTNGMSGEKEKNWTLVCANPDTDGQKYYYFKEGDGQEKVRVTYTDKDGKEHISDMFNPSEVNDVFTTYEIALYPGENNIGEIKAKANDGTEYAISANTGTLTVRAVEDTDPTSDIQSAAPTEPVVSGNAVAVAPEGGTTYTLNNTGVPLPVDGSKPSLLFDSIIEDGEDSTARTDALINRVDETLGAVASNTTRHYEVKYLDLVDANNGNAWITSSAGTDIYWGYPEGTDDKTTFKLVHFKELHRDGENSGYDVSDINNLSSDNIEVVDVNNTENGIKFHVDAGGFSPFALVWEESTTPDPGPDPDPTPTPDPEEPELERDDHYAYIFGYEDNTIRPENDITRAEVATIFYRLLTDESREAYRTTDHDFTDVSADAWYAEPVATLAGAGLLAGYEDGSFRPDAPITRAEYAAIATRFDELAAAESNFTDISGHWAEAAINAAYGAGWVGGYEDGTFRPDQNISRAEAMALINRVLERAVDSEGMLDEMTHWADNDPEAWYYADIQEATHSHTYEREEGEQYENWTDLVPHKVF